MPPSPHLQDQVKVSQWIRVMCNGVKGRIHPFSLAKPKHCPFLVRYGEGLQQCCQVSQTNRRKEHNTPLDENMYSWPKDCSSGLKTEMAEGAVFQANVQVYESMEK